MQKKPRKFTEDDLKDMQALPLERKIQISQTRIIEYIQKTGGKCAVSFSGGKDSTVVLDLVRRVNPEIPAIFSNTGLEFPEIVKFAMSKDNVIVVRPKKNFMQVLLEFGYPLISKDISLRIRTARLMDGEKGYHSKRCVMGTETFIGTDGQEHESFFNCEKYLPLSQLPIRISDMCCRIIKEAPIAMYQKEHGLSPIMGTMAAESRRRKKGWLTNGCNLFAGSNTRSMPIGFWTEQDVFWYIKKYKIPICSVYGEIVPETSASVKNSNGICLKCSGRDRTGCTFCCYGVHLEEGETRFQKLAKTHPRLYDFCMRGGQWVDNPDYDPTKPVYAKDCPGWLNWNPKKIWVPGHAGLGYRVMLDLVNSVYGKDFIRYD